MRGVATFPRSARPKLSPLAERKFRWSDTIQEPSRHRPDMNCKNVYIQVSFIWPWTEILPSKKEAPVPKSNKLHTERPHHQFRD